MVTSVRVSAHQDRICSSRTRRWRFSMRPVGPNTVVSPDRLASKWGVDHHRTRSRKVVSALADLGG
jgi:hypothetical protein